ncbi:MAG: LCP family protein [Lachnospiraceae bacterium]|nr:LCP family protein [Lachnospiraceae bacterium]
MREENRYPDEAAAPELSPAETREAEAIERKKARRKRRRRRRLALLFLELVLLLLIGAGVYVVSKWNKIEKNEINVVVNPDIDKKTEEAMTGTTTLALFGVDSRDIKHKDKGVHGDVDMLLVIDNKTGEMKLASLYRDTLIAIDTENKLGKLTSAYFYGGAENAVNMINRNFDLTIEDYVTVNWAAVAVAVNDLGGVEIDVTEEMLSYKNQINGYILETVNGTGIPSTQIKHTGVQIADGIQAVAYCRVRYHAGDDVGRTRRQREVVRKLFDKVKKADPATLNKLLDDVLPMVQTSLTESEVLKLVSLLPKLHFAEGGMEAFPKEANRRTFTYNKGAVQAPETLVDVAGLLHTFLYGNESYTPSPMVKRLSTLIHNAK